MGLSVFDLMRQGPRVKHEAVLFPFDLLESRRGDDGGSAAARGPLLGKGARP